jgi:diamine N-acetyltransferase
MSDISIHDVTRENWRVALTLAVYPDQQRFIADSTPIAAIALAKAYICPANLVWKPYALYVDTTMVGFIELAYLPNSHDQYWIYHFFIDYRYQAKGYGTQTLKTFITFVKQHYPSCRMIQLTVHPENTRAQKLYSSIGFQATGQVMNGEPVYQLTVSPREL